MGSAFGTGATSSRQEWSLGRGWSSRLRRAAHGSAGEAAALGTVDLDTPLRGYSTSMGGDVAV
ncbi:hypothetical protein C1I64_10920 [Rathayibacter festucae DSM 15932]|uniref:Uncharacterized protein n=1 Tax=Rathayibacter festucae DSM 15932 TaxID=1328866 RepID=A0A3T0T1S1_9MICO|nr:hypothetical protein C1I64_10920 [Rathayibacter festucae DSM 15932]